MISFVNPNYLLSHEETNKIRLNEIKKSIIKNGLKKPIIVDAASFVILDGHHRVQALKELGASRIPVYFVNYYHASVTVKPRRNIKVSKEIVLFKAYSNSPFPEKTTLHELSTTVPEVNIKLEKMI